MEPLIDAEALEDLPGAPVPDSLLQAAAEAVRTEAGWHIAPQITETVEVETYKNRIAVLPTLRVSKIIAVRNADTGDELDGWRINKRTGILKKRSGYWPEVIEVELEHGFTKCPPELLTIISERIARGKAGNVTQESLASRSVRFSDSYDSAGVSILNKYSLAARP